MSTKTFLAVLSRSGKSGYISLFPDLKREAFSLSLLCHENSVNYQVRKNRNFGTWELYSGKQIHRKLWELLYLLDVKGMIIYIFETQDCTSKLHTGGFGRPLVKNSPCNSEDMSSIPSRGTKVPCAVEHLSPYPTTTDPACLNKDSTCHN